MQYVGPESVHVFLATSLPSSLKNTVLCTHSCFLPLCWSTHGTRFPIPCISAQTRTRRRCAKCAKYVTAQTHRKTCSSDAFSTPSTRSRVHPHPPTDAPDCFEYHVHYRGWDVAPGTVVDTPQQCQALCISHPDCELFTMNMVNRGCGMKPEGVIVRDRYIDDNEAHVQVSGKGKSSCCMSCSDHRTMPLPLNLSLAGAIAVLHT